MSLWKRIFRERRAVLLPLVIVLAANVAVLALGVLPLSRNVASLDDDATNATFGLARARMLEKQARDARTSKERADQELKKLYGEILPKSFAASLKLVAFLERTAMESGLTFQRSQTEQTGIKDSELVKVTAKVTLTGDYQKIRKFLYTVETAPEFAIVERVGLAQAGDLKNTGALDVTLDVATYYHAAGSR